MRCRLIVKAITPAAAPGEFTVTFRDVFDPAIADKDALSKLPQGGTITRLVDSAEAQQFAPGSEWFLDLTPVPGPAQ